MRPTDAEVQRVFAGHGTQTNHEHTQHPKAPMTWRRLLALDSEWATMAIHAARRYGYEAPDVGTNRRTVCGLREADNRWECRLEDAAVPRSFRAWRRLPAPVVGRHANGPSVVRAQGRYLCYFARHDGRAIEVASAPGVDGGAELASRPLSFEVGR